MTSLSYVRGPNSGSYLASDNPGLTSLRVHDLRHTAASIAVSCGASILALQKMLGHEKASVTLDTYGHLYTADLERLAGQVDDALRQSPGETDRLRGLVPSSAQAVVDRP